MLAPDSDPGLRLFFWLGGRVVMQRPAKPRTPVRFRPQPFLHLFLMSTNADKYFVKLQAHRRFWLSDFATRRGVQDFSL